MTLDELVAAALAEDIGPGDITTRAVVSPEKRGRGAIDARMAIVVSGLAPAEAAFRLRGVDFRACVSDGDALEAGTVVAEVEGPVIGILEAERVALNFLMRLSGIATHTSGVVAAAEGRIAVLDTRKSTPLHRALEKAAVQHGGGENHRMGLYDMVLIKENHLRAAGGVARAVGLARAAARGVQVEVEVETMDQLEEAIAAKVDLVLLDNMDDGQLAEAVKRVAGRVVTEASGNMTAERIRGLRDLGLDRVSMGGLIHQARWVDMGLELED